MITAVIHSTFVLCLFVYACTVLVIKLGTNPLKANVAKLDPQRKFCWQPIKIRNRWS